MLWQSSSPNGPVSSCVVWTDSHQEWDGMGRMQIFLELSAQCFRCLMPSTFPESLEIPLSLWTLTPPQ